MSKTKENYQKFTSFCCNLQCSCSLQMVLIGDGNLSLHKIANKIHSIETNAPTKTKTAAPSSPLLPLLSLSSILFSLYFLSLSLSHLALFHLFRNSFSLSFALIYCFQIIFVMFSVRYFSFLPVSARLYSIRMKLKPS